MIAIFTNQTELNRVSPLPSRVTVGNPIQSLDGRVAISHNFTDSDISHLQNAGAILSEILPLDWQYSISN